MIDYIKGSIWGLIIGDALGVPVEFKDRESLRTHPVTDMREYGTHHQPKGTWSDDSSMMLCTLDSLCKGRIDYNDMMKKFSSWLFDDEYTPYGEAFDYGGATYRAIDRYRNGTAPLACGGTARCDNGNGSLMRILPVVLYQFEKCQHFVWNYRPMMLDPIHEASSLTHAHSTSMVGCGLYAQYLGAMIRYQLGESRESNILDELNQTNAQAWNDYDYNGWGNIFHDENYHEAIKKYARLKDARAFAALPEEEIKSGGYVVNTLEAAMWCFLNTDSFADCVLKAVNLGDDADTTAAVAGSIAGAYYGIKSIPTEWLSCIARKEWITQMVDRFELVIMENKKFRKSDYRWSDE